MGYASTNPGVTLTDALELYGFLPGRLNPAFTEVLMGWPIGWTDVDAKVSVEDSAPFPPRPEDKVAWISYLSRFKAAKPATYDAPYRMDRLRACGNGVVPTQAEMAFAELFSELGL